MVPNRGSVTWWQSASTRMAPVVNRTDRREWCRVFMRGKPTAAPARSPHRDADQFSRARASPSNPEL
jgi:hypothetical protein